MPALLPLLVSIVIIGVIVYLVRLIPMPEPFPTIVLVVGVLFVLIAIAHAFGFSV